MQRPTKEPSHTLEPYKLMEPQLEWIYHEAWETRPEVERGASWKGKKSHDRRYRSEPKALKDKANVRMNGLNHHLVVEIPGKAITPARHPCFSDHANRLGEANLEEPAVKKGSREGPPHPECIREQVRQSRRGRVIKDKNVCTSCDSPGEARKAKVMASSSGSKPMTEERLNSLEDNLQRLKQMLEHQLDFLQNLDIDAGRRLEMLEDDITSTNCGLTEELGKLRKELKDPKQEFENRINSLEEKMEQLNKEWKEERDQSKKGDPK
jgi:hypothetical protein